MDTKSLLKIDCLREAAASYGSSPYCFGLGFIQLKLSDQARMHFWHMAVPHVEREEIHNHRYDFTSVILAGALRQELYHVRPGHATFEPIIQSEWEMFETTCAPGEEGAVTTTQPVEVISLGAVNLAKGSNYSLPITAFHTTEGTDFAITFLRRGEKVKQFAEIVKLKGAPTTCPFANPGTPEDCWEMIKLALDYAKL